MGRSRPIFAGQAPPSERAPDQRAKTLVGGKRHQFGFVGAADQRIIDLMRDETRPAVAIGDRLRLHDLPAGIVGNAGITDLAPGDQSVERAHDFLGRCRSVEGMELEQIDIVGAQAPQRILDRADQPGAGRAPILRSISHRQTGFGRDQHGITAVADRRAENLLGGAVGIDVRRVEQSDAGIQTQVHQPPRLGDIARSPGAEQRPVTAKCPGAEAQRRYAQTRRPQLPIFHHLLIPCSFGA